ncbi:MAG TPA: M28 family peptidase [Steroidobacteraceae bacterium]|nr:M28 family peptidase [Steroidobacteraceae bacterium]
MHLRRILVYLLTVALLASGIVSCVSQPGVKAVESPEVTVELVALQRHVQALAVTYHPRSVENFAMLEAAGDYVLAEMRAAGAAPEIQNVDVNGTMYRNFIARFGPPEGSLLVIGAHYDACGQTPGADDNASGVAALLELTRLLARDPPSQPVELVAYTLEEPPYFRTEFMGSFRHASALAQQKRQVRLMVSLEMIGYFRDEPRSQDYPVAGLGLLYPDQGNFIAIVGAFNDVSNMRRIKALFKGASDLPVESINAPSSVPGVDFSDHASYWRFDMPAVMVTDTAFLRNPNYHEPGDTPETLDYARMAKVVRAMHAVAMQF